MMSEPTLPTVERASDRELVVSAVVSARAPAIFAAWTQADLFQRWWLPKSFGLTLHACEMDARTGGGYRLLISPPGADQPMEFFGRYLEVTPPSRVVWTNDEGGEPGAVTTVTFEDLGGKTRVVLRDLYPSKAALDEAIESGSTGGYPEQFAALAALLAGETAP